jgi:hypothetical protein
MLPCWKAVWYEILCAVVGLSCLDAHAAVAPKKPHVVALGAVRQVPYSRAGDPAGAGPAESSLKTRALLVDGRVSEWTTGDAHDVTDRSFVVRRALRINDTLPADKAEEAQSANASKVEHWVWQRGPWLLVDRLTGHVTALKLPDYDPGASQVAWFRDYAAYCGIPAKGKTLYAVVAQVGGRKPVLAKILIPYDAANAPWPVCGLPEWQRLPLKVTFYPSGKDDAKKDAVSFDLVGGSAVLVEDGDDGDPRKP